MKEKLDYVVDAGKVHSKSKTLDVEVFEIPEEGLFLASANQGRDKNMNSTIYKWSGSRFLPIQYIRTNKARHWNHFSIESEVRVLFILVGFRFRNSDAAIRTTKTRSIVITYRLI